MSRKSVASRLVIPVLLALSMLLAACQSSATAVSPSPTAAEIASSTPEETATAASTTYSWRGTNLTLAVDLPDGPDQAAVYLGQPDSAATITLARELANQFGMQGEIYASEGDSLLVVDSNRRLEVQFQDRFIYYPSHFNYAISDTAIETPADAQQQIDSFLQLYGFDGDYTIKHNGYLAGYFAEPLSPDGFPFHFAHFAASGFWFDFDTNGIVSVRANLLRYEPVSDFGIISADEAFQKLLAPDPNYGIEEAFHSQTYPQPMAWMREYPVDQTITIYGYMDSIPSADSGDPLISVDGYTVTGNTSGIDASMPQTFVQATGNFHTENGTEYFVLDSWQPHAPQEGWLGTLEKQGDDVMLVTNDHGTLLMPDIPADVPLPLTDVYALGVTVGNSFEWSFFDLRMARGGGGGGGGGGLGLYDVNLSGTPMPLPTLASPEQLQPKVGEHLDGLRGLVSVTLYNQPDGSQRAEYRLFYGHEGQPFSTEVILQGEKLQALQGNQNRPADIWGMVTGFNTYGIAEVEVERFEIPFPELQFRILHGTQQTVDIDGQPGILFTTTEGQQYLQITVGGGLESPLGLLGYEGDEVILESLVIPGETVAGYATVHTFSGSVAAGPNNQPLLMEITADQPYVMDEPTQEEIAYKPPAAIIDNIELVYLAPYQVHRLPDTDFYIQPMWRFTGHYENGDEFEVFVQALKPEFLSPVIVTVEPAG